MKNKVIHLSGLEVIGEHSAHDPHLLGAEYLKSMSPDVLRTYDDLGMAPEFTAIMSRHLSDINLVLPRAGHKDNGISTLSVKKFERPNSPHEWKRVAIISRDQIKQRSVALASVLHEQGINNKVDGSQLDDGMLASIAFDWVFFELSADIAANSFDMQQKYDRYIPDWNGQAEHYLAQYSISREVYREYAEEVDEHHVIADHANFKGGIALLLLKDDLLFQGIVDDTRRACWVTERLKQDYPVSPNEPKGVIVPLDKQQIVQRLVNLKPRESMRQRMAEFAYLFLDELLEDDQTDVES